MAARGLEAAADARVDQAGDSARLTSWTIQPLPSGSLNDRNEL
jgi:hypothetical protein